ncbi:MAG: hypothetical protein AAF447_17125 [Myxococcota bacterium]
MRLYVLWPVLVLVLGCGSDTVAMVDGPDASVDASAGDAGTPGACADAREVGSLDDVVALVPETFGSSEFEVDQAVSGSIRATETFDLLFAALPLPSDCVAPPEGRCTTEVVGGSFRDYPESRISFIEGGVRVTPGALFQLRFNVVNWVDGTRFVEVVLEQAPCLPCLDDNLRCAEDDGCYPIGAGSYCQSCLRGSESRCACWEVGDTFRTSGQCTIIRFSEPPVMGECSAEGECIELD